MGHGIPSKRGQASNLNLAVSGILAPVGGIGRHNHPKCSTGPNTNRVFWDRKRETNMARDRCVTRQLRGRGWKVIRLWQLPSAVYAALRLSVSPEACLNRIRRTLKAGANTAPKRP